MTPRKAPRSRAEQREQTRRQLVRAGLRVVAKHGFAGASTAAVAKATGKAHGTVFVHFQTRDALVSELVAELGRAISLRLAALETPAPELAEVLDSHLTALGEHEAIYARLLCEASTLPLSARAQVFALQSGIAWRIRGAYERARERGAARAIDATALANVWIALTNHYLMNRDLFAPGASVIERFGATLKQQLLAIVAP